MNCTGEDYFALLVLNDAATLHHERARKLMAAHRRGRCVGLEDLRRAVDALESRRKCFDAFERIARRITGSP